MRLQFLTRIGSSCLIACCLHSPLRAEDQRATYRARALFQAGREAADSGDYERACPLFEESYASEPGIGTEFNLADCLERIGRKAEARQHFRNVVRRTRELEQEERRHVAEARAGALERDLPSIIVIVDDPPAGLEVTRNGEPVAEDEWGHPFFIDPGIHEIAVTAPGKESWSIDLDVDNPGTVIAVPIPPLADRPLPKPAAIPATAPAKKKAIRNPTRPRTEPRRSRPGVEPDGNTMEIITLVGAGIGAVVAGTSFVIYKIRDHDARAICPSGTNCSQAEADRHASLVEDARLARGIGYVGLGLAGASLTTLGILSLTKSSGREGARTADVGIGADVAADGSSVGARLSGRW